MLTVMRGRRIFCSLIKSHGILEQPAVINLCCIWRLNSSAVDWNAVHAGKVAVMTASTDGIGFAVARRLAQQGAHVVLSSRKQENVDKAINKLQSENLSVSGTVCNVTDKDHRKNLVELALGKHGKIDYLFSNAAKDVSYKNTFDTTEEEWTEVFHTNVTATFLLVKHVLPHMQKLGGGSIVLTSSAAAYSFFPYVGPYNVSKTALAGLTKMLASELLPMNIRLNSLAPGLTRTQFSSGAWANEDFLKDLIKVYGFLSERILQSKQDDNLVGLQAEPLELRGWGGPNYVATLTEVRGKKTQIMGLNGLGEPEEFAGIVSFLFSSDASYVTRETVVVGGGYKTRL